MGTDYIASFQQQRLWQIHHKAPERLLLTQQCIALSGQVDQNKLRDCFEVLFRQYELFRTSLVQLDGESRPVQRIDEPGQFYASLSNATTETDVQHLLRETRIREELKQIPPFTPFLDLCFYDIQPDRSLLVLTAPSYIADRQTLKNLFRETARLYQVDGKVDRANQDAHQYVDLTQWMEELNKTEEAKKEHALLRMNLDSSVEQPSIAFDTHAGCDTLFADGQVDIQLPNEAMLQSTQIEVNDFVALWIMYLSELSAGSKVTTGIHHSGRGSEDFEGLCGPFAKIVPVVADTTKGYTFNQASQDVLLDYQEIAEIQDYFSWELVESQFGEQFPYFPYAYEYSCVVEETYAPDIKATIYEGTSLSEPAALKLEIQEIEGRFSCRFRFNKARFSSASIDILSMRFAQLLQQVFAEQEGRDRALALFSAAERDRQLRDWSSSGESSVSFASYHSWFEAQVEKSPLAVAVSGDGDQLTYQQLNEQANQFGRYLLSCGLEKGDIVGLHMGRSPSTVVALLGTLKAGGSYLPLDIDYPVQRLCYMIEDANVKFVVSSGAQLLEDDGLNGRTTVARWSEVAEACRALAEENISSDIDSTDTIYTIYTSGSTGKPKGIEVSNGSVVTYVDWASRTYELQKGCGSLVHSSISFDLTVTSLLAPLVVGQTVILLSQDNGIESLVDALSQNKNYSLLKLTPSHLEILNARLTPADMSGCVRTIVIGGEALKAKQVQPWLTHSSDTALFNEYGPTEATVGCCAERVTVDSMSSIHSGSVPIGRPIDNANLFVLNDKRELLPVGETGELYIGGAGLAKGILNNPERTREVFITVSVTPTAKPQRLYKTGDLVQYLADGRLIYLGRKDRQVKVNGFRIELGEIESAVHALPSVKSTCVITRQIGDIDDGSQQLVSYVVWAGEYNDEDFDQVKSELRGTLPDYMVPDVWVSLDEMPLDNNGKIAISELPEPARRTQYCAPRTEQETILCKVWEEVLNGGRDDLPPIGIDDNYFSVGGDSIRSIQVIALAKKHNIHFNIEQMFDFPTIRSLLENTDYSKEEIPSTTENAYSPFSLVSDRDRPKIPHGIEDAYPITVLQGGMIFHNELDDKSTSVYHDIFSYRLRCKVDFSLMERAANELFERHAALRTSFDLLNFSEPLQLVNRDIPPVIAFEDIRMQSQAEQERTIIQRLEDFKTKGFDVTKPPLAEFFVHWRDKDQIQFTLSFHHSIIDGWSDATMLSELFVHYLNLVEGEEIEIKSPEDRYSDYVVLEKQAVNNKLSQEYWQSAILNEFEFTRLPKINIENNESVVHIKPVNIDEELSSGIKQLSQQLNVPVKNLLLSAHIRVLEALSNQPDVTTCMVSSGRPETGEADRVLGLFINSIPMRVKTRDLTWKQLCQKVFSLEKEALPHRRFPLGKIQEMNAGNPISDSLFYFTHYHIFDTAFDAGEIEFQELIPHEVSSFPFVGNFHISPLDGSVNCSLACSGKFFSEQAVNDFALMYQHALENMVRHPERNSHHSQLLDEQTVQGILKDAVGESQSISELKRIEDQFQRMVEDHPGRIALKYKNEQWTYRQLDQMSNSAAHYLVAQGVKPGSRVGVCLDRSEKTLISLLAILKLGSSYIPLDIDLPLNRVASICESAELSHLLTLSTKEVEFREVANRILTVDTLWVAMIGGPKESLGLNHSVDDLMYIIFTSGSTGQPKGVRITHKNVANFLKGMDREIGEPSEGDSLLALTNLSFDISVLEVFWSLTRGMSLVLQSVEDSKLVSVPARNARAQVLPNFSLFYFADDNVKAKPGRDKYKLLIEGAEFADKHQFEAVWLPERHFHSFGGLYPNPSVLAAAVASRTTSVHIRSGSVVLPLHDPIRVAEEWAVVDNLSDGRVGLSLASGWNPNDFVFAPQNYENRKQVLSDGLGVISDLWSGKSLNIERGEKTFNVELFPKPVQESVPIWFTAAGNPATFEAAGAAGANVLTHFLGQQEAELETKIQVYRQAREAAGYDPDTGRVSLMIHSFLWKDSDEIKEIVHDPFIHYLRNSVGLAKSMLSNMGISDNAPSEDLAEILEFAFERYFKESGLFGTPEQCVGRVKRLTMAGVDEICCLIDFGVDHDKVMQSLELLKELKDAFSPSHHETQSPQKPLMDYSIAAQIKRHDITHIQMTPGLAAALVDDELARVALPRVEKLLVGGEVLSQKLASELQALLEPNTLMNMYGPTEATIWSTVKSFGESSDQVTIGKPILNTSAYIVGKDGHLLPRGVFGDLYLGGAGISPGYQNLPEQTQKQFRSNPFSDDTESKIYFTGDVARLLENGEIEFSNRVDNQIKFRGYRIELGEIESVLNTHPMVSQSVVLPYYSEQGGAVTGLVAHILVANDASFSAAPLKEHVSRTLPDYMQPTVIQAIDAFPKTSNGKIDRKAFPPPKLAGYDDARTSDVHASVTSTLIAGVWADILNVAEIGPHDNFFELGGLSIQASQAIAQLRDIFKLEVPLKSLFESPTPVTYARFISEYASSASSSVRTLSVREDPAAPVELSLSQKGVWFADELSGHGSTYNEPAVVKITGQLDAVILSQSLDLLCAKHEALRLRFFVDKNVPVQIVGDSNTFDLTVLPTITDGSWMSHVEEQIRTPFDLGRGSLARASLIPIGQNEHVLTIVLHHLISDGWSMRVFLQDLTSLYEAVLADEPDSVPALDYQYLDYVAWQNELSEDGSLQQSLEYWSTKLNGIQQTEFLAVDHQRDNVREYQGSTEFFEFSPELSQRLKAVSKEHRVTLFIVLTTVFKTMLSVRSGQKDIVIATDSANRGTVETEKMIGLFVNQLVLRTDLAKCHSISDVLGAVRHDFLETTMHPDVPYELVLQKVLAGQAREETSLFQAKFVFQDNALSTFSFADLDVEPVDVVRGTSKFEFLLNAIDQPDGVSFSIEYDSRLFEQSTIVQISKQFRLIAERIADNQDISLEELIKQIEADESRQDTERVTSYKRSKKDLLRTLRTTE